MLDTTMLSKYDVSDLTHWVEILDYEGEPICADGKEPFVIEIVHVDNHQYKKDKNFLLEKHQKKSKGKRGTEFSPDDLEEISIKMAAKLTRGWKNLFDNDGNEIKYSFDAAVELYKNYGFIMQQVEEAAQERANFTRKG